MKKIIIMIFMICISNSYSQLKDFFPDSNACFSVSYMKFWFQGDTVVENFQYKKIYMQMHDSIADFNRADYFAAIREDTVGEKVYGILSYDAKEHLLYDFSVDVGDIVYFYSLWGGPREREQIVESVDSIFIDGYYRRRINFDGEDYRTRDAESWIEGIGSTHGLFFAGSFDVIDGMDWTYLLCVHVEERLIYQSDYYYNCYLKEYVDIVEKGNTVFKIYPTITRDYLFVESFEKDNYSYEIFNTQGIKVKSGFLDADNIDVSILKQGFFIIRFLSRKGQKVYINKFIKH